MKTTENKNIGDLYRDSFGNFSFEPSADVWKGIQSKMTSSPAPKSGFNKSFWKIIGGSAAVIIAVTAVLLFINNRQNKPESAKNQPVVAQNNNSNQEITNTSSNKNTVNTVFESNDVPSNNPANQSLNNTSNINNSNSNNTENNAVAEEPVTNSSAKTNIENPVKEKEVTPELQNPVKNTTPENPKPGKKSGPAVSPAIKTSGTSNESVTLPKDKTICFGDETKLEVAGGKYYRWNTGEITSSITVNPQVSAVYSVIVTKTDGSTITGSVKVTVDEGCSSIWVPNAFSPNGDFTNSTFKAIGSDIKEFQITVYNRNATVVYESKDINQGWDGTIHGDPAPMGTYIYYIKYVDGLNNAKVKSGVVNLIR